MECSDPERLLPQELEVKGGDGVQLGIMNLSEVEERTKHYLSLDGGGNRSLKKRGTFHSTFISNIYIEYVCVPSAGDIAVNKAKAQPHGADITANERY